MDTVDSTSTISGRAERPSPSPGVGVQGELSHPHPPWLYNVARRCEQLVALPPNWDTYGARPIPGATAAESLLLLTRIASPHLPAPVVSPTPAGGLNFEWNLLGKTFELEVTAPGHVAALFVDETTGSEWEEPDLGSNLTRVIAALRMLSAP